MKDTDIDKYYVSRRRMIGLSCKLCELMLEEPSPEKREIFKDYASSMWVIATRSNEAIERHLAAQNEKIDK